jgi:ABC-type branched-subunit amino acid transport system permease subunit
MDIGSVLVVALIVLLWIAAAAVGTDSRDGRDWTASRDGDERRNRIGS